MFQVFLVCLLSVSCSKDDNETDTQVTITPTSISLYYEDTQQLSATNATSWNTEDEFVAEVNKNGLVTGGHVGTTKIVASNGKSSAICEVTIKPKYNLYDTPILDWNASTSSIKSQETHTFSSSSSSTILAYDYTKSSSNPCIVMYEFENNKLYSVSVFIDYQFHGYATNYLLERYQPVYSDKTSYTAIFADAYDKSKWRTCVGLGTVTISGTKLTRIMFMPASSLPSFQTNTRSAIAKVENEDTDIFSIIQNKIDYFQ